MIELLREPRLRGRSRRGERSSGSLKELRRSSLNTSGVSDEADLRAANDEHLSPVLHAVAVAYCGRPVGY